MTNKSRANPAVQPGNASAYILAMIGSVIYYVSIAHGFWSIVLACLKAVVWPAFLTHDLLLFIGG